MRTIGQLLGELIEREGGYVDHPADRGGPTRYGITAATARAAGYAGAMSALPMTLAEEIYRQRYWIAPGFGTVATRAPTLAAELFDTGVNMGVTTAGVFLQRALNALNRGARDYPDLLLDGAIGGKTIAALDAFLKLRGAAGEAALVKACDALQGERYIALCERDPAQEAFAYGWLSQRLGQAA